MATSASFREYVLEQFGCMDGITCRPMMGEYLLYCRGVLFGGIYDNRVLIKRTDGNAVFDMPTEIPYDGAKPMYAADIEDTERLKQIVELTCAELATKKGGKK